MELTLYQVDAFTNKVFEGNPAAICPLTEWLPDGIMQSIAVENNLSETAFFIPTDNGYHIRWFTPANEVDLCGHATLASAAVIFNQLRYDREVINFESRSGILSVSKQADGLQMNFPSRPSVDCDTPIELINALGCEPVSCQKGEDYLAVFDDEEFVRSVEPDFSLLAQLDCRGIIITAAAKEYDFVSRFFAPRHNINEDPVTGSSFTQLAPYWSGQLGKATLKARQVSSRGGDITCIYNKDRVSISGNTVLYMTATIQI